MDENSSDKKIYIALFEQKEKLFELVKNKKLNPQSYFQIL